MKTNETRLLLSVLHPEPAVLASVDVLKIDETQASFGCGTVCREYLEFMNPQDLESLIKGNVEFRNHSVCHRVLQDEEYPPYDPFQHNYLVTQLREAIMTFCNDIQMDNRELCQFFRLDLAPYPKCYVFYYDWDPKNHPEISDRDFLTIETYRSDSALYPVSLQIARALEGVRQPFWYRASLFSAIIECLYKNKSLVA